MAKKQHQPIKINSQLENQQNIRVESNSLKIFTWLSLLIIITFATYYRTTQNSLTNWDDDKYVAKNSYLHNFTPTNLKAIFFGGHESYFMGNYHPLTIISLGIDYQMSSLDKDKRPEPYFFALHNVILHVLNSILVFFFLYYLLKLIRFKSFFEIAIISAFVFALHTMHVESVAWLSERKDVLYVYYFVAALLAYVGFQYKRNYLFYVLSIFLFTLSCLAKGQAVSLSVSLLAIDYLLKRKLLSKQVILEKIPFFIIALLFGYLAIQAQKVGEAVHSFYEYTVLERLMISSYGLMMYILKMFFPFSLSAMYPYTVITTAFPAYWYAYLLVPIIVIYTFYVVFKKSKIQPISQTGQDIVNIKNSPKSKVIQTKTNPKILVDKEDETLKTDLKLETNNWQLLAFIFLFFGINLILLLQFIPVGSAVYSDRYVYVSSIAYSLLIGLIYSIIKENKPQLVSVFVVFIFIYVGVLSYLTFDRIAVWKDSITLWTDVIDKNELAVVGYNNRGSAYKEANRVQDAINDFTRAINYKPDYKSSLYNRGTAYKDINKLNEAMNDFNKALLLDPNFVEAYHNRGLTYDLMGKTNEAVQDFTKALKYDPRDVKVFVNRGVSYGKSNRMELAIADFKKALEIDPVNSDAYSNLGLAHSHKQMFDIAIGYYNRAIELNPKFTDAFFNRAIAQRGLKKYDNAIADLSAAIGIKPEFSMAFFQRGLLYKETNKKNEACTDFQKAYDLGLKIQPIEIELKTYCNK